MNTDDLLTHADFVRCLAKSLVLDEHRAADITQDTWLAALEHPPATGKPLRAWLAKVVRNFARITHRRDNRRSERERTAARTGSLPTPAEIVEREEARRRMVDAVLALEEPYRTTVLLRFYEDLSTNEVAERQGIPLSTVRTRVRRGLEQVRARLDDTYHGRRATWCLALAPLVGLTFAKPAAAATTGAGISKLFSGAFTVSAKVKAGVASVFVIVTAVAFYQLLPDYSDEDRIPSSHGSAEEAAPVAEALPPVQPGVQEAVATAAGSTPKARVAPEGTVISGRVEDKVTEEPVKAFSFRLRQLDEKGKWKLAVSETVRNERGIFRFPLEQGGTYRLWIRTTNFLEKDISSLEVPDEGLEEYVIQLDPGSCMRGRVVEDATGRPVEGAVIIPWGEREAASYSLTTLLRDPDAMVNHARTDKEGYFTLGALGSSKTKVTVSHPDFAAETVYIDREEEKVIRLRGGFHIFGKAFDDEGHPAEGVLITMAGEETPVPRPVLTGPGGLYWMPPARPDRMFLHAHPFYGKGDDVPEFTQEIKVVELTDRDLEVNFGPSEDNVTWRGTVHDLEDEPASGTMISLYPASLELKGLYLYRSTREVDANSEGRFEFKKLQTGTYNVDVFFRSPKSLHKEYGDIRFDEPGVVERDIRFSKPQVSGVVVDALTGEVIKGRGGSVFIASVSDSSLRLSSGIDAEGRFSFVSLRDGAYNVVVRVDDYTSNTQVPGFRVKEGERIDDLRIPVEPGGKVKVKVLGFEESDPRAVHVFFRSEKRRQIAYTLRPQEEEGKHTRQLTLTFEAGLWSASLSLKDLGFVTRTFEIKPGKTAEVVIHKKDFISADRKVTVAGTVRHADGTPVSGASLVLAEIRVHEESEGEPEPPRQGKTDSEGRFRIQDLRPGFWFVTLRLPEGCRVYYPNQLFPGNAVDPYPLDLIVPEGAVKCTLHDAVTEKALEADKLVWKAELWDTKMRRRVGSLHSLHQENRSDRIEMAAVLTGKYELSISARGYYEYKSTPFTVEEGRTLDLGRVDLEPCGCLILEVKNEAGKAVDSYRLFCNDREIPWWRREELSPGRYFYNDLPPEPAVITILSDGFGQKDVEVELAPAQPHELRVKLESL